MHEIIWAVIALAVLGLLMLLGVGQWSNSGYSSSAFSLEEMFEGGLFAMAFMIVLLPLMPFYFLGQVVWQRFHPPLPVEGDDPVWGRNVNRKVAETAFLAVQQAWMRRNPELARDFVGPYLYDTLKGECRRLTTQHEVNTRQDIQVQEITISDEAKSRAGDVYNQVTRDAKIDGEQHLAYCFKATIRGTMINVMTHEPDGQIMAGSSDSQPFEVKLEFARRPDAADHWQMTTVSDWPHEMKSHAGHAKQKPHGNKAEPPAS